jgi:hypothetical protein
MPISAALLRHARRFIAGQVFVVNPLHGERNCIGNGVFFDL